MCLHLSNQNLNNLVTTPLAETSIFVHQEIRNTILLHHHRNLDSQRHHNLFHQLRLPTRRVAWG